MHGEDGNPALWHSTHGAHLAECWIRRTLSAICGGVADRGEEGVQTRMAPDDFMMGGGPSRDGVYTALIRRMVDQGVLHNLLLPLPDDGFVARDGGGRPDKRDSPMARQDAHLLLRLWGGDPMPEERVWTGSLHPVLD